jgi:hypothetical protein
MAVQYQVDGNIFSEITTNWLCAHVREFLIKARQLGTDQAGNAVEYFQLNDGRVFTRLVPGPQATNIPQTHTPRLRNTQPVVIREHSITQR